MNIKFEPLNPNDEGHLEAFAKWDKDLSFQHLRTPRFDKKPIKISSKEELYKKFSKNPNKCSEITVIKDGDKVIGEYSIQIDPPHLLKHQKNTSWFGITIGEKEYWGSGVAKLALEKIEHDSKYLLGAERIELGVFEFNQRAFNFYKKMNYIEFARIENFTYWNGKFWQDIRMEKYL